MTNNRLTKYTLILAITVVFLSLCVLSLNYFIYQYPGNNYFPANFLSTSLLLVLIGAGFHIALGHHSRISTTIREFIYCYIIFSIIALASNAAQYSPFQPIDNLLIIIDNYMFFNNVSLLNILQNHPRLVHLLDIIYGSLSVQLFIIPVFCIVLQNTKRLREFYFLMLLTTLIGFTFYYFWPTIGPASAYNNPVFSPSQFATGLKFNQIRNHISPTTIDGGLIAMPSFHVIWAWYCVYLVIDYKYLFWPLLVINCILTIACVILGWHYLIDIIASMILIALCHIFLCKIKPEHQGS
jgi:hypothetical protein